MIRPDDPDLNAEREVGEAYRAQPCPEPSAELDARIRAAVQSEVSGQARSARLFAFPWWRHAGPPLAVAASVLIAVGLGHRWFSEGPVDVEESAHIDGQQAPLAAAPPADAPTARVAPSANGTGLEARAPAPQEPSAPDSQTLAHPERAAVRDKAPPSLDREQAPLAAAPPPQEPSALDAQAPPRPEGSALRDKELPSLVQVRELLAQGDRQAARQVLERWRQVHPGEALPEEFRGLLDGPGREASPAAKTGAAR